MSKNLEMVSLESRRGTFLYRTGKNPGEEAFIRILEKETAVILDFGKIF